MRLFQVLLLGLTAAHETLALVPLDAPSFIHKLGLRADASASASASATSPDDSLPPAVYYTFSAEPSAPTPNIAVPTTLIVASGAPVPNHRTPRPSSSSMPLSSAAEPASSAPASTASSYPPDAPSESADVGIIVGALVGGIAFVATTAYFVVWLVLRKRREAHREAEFARGMNYDDHDEQQPHHHAYAMKRKHLSVVLEVPASEMHETPAENTVGGPRHVAELMGRPQSPR